MIQTLATKEGKELLQENYIGYLSYIAGKWPYTVPITYYYSKAQNMIISYAAVGHKIESMRKNPNVSLAVSDICSVRDWRSVLAHGTFEELEGMDAKYYLHEFAEGVKKVLQRKEHTNPTAISEFSSKMDSEKYPIVYRIVVDEMTAKFRVE